MMVCVMAPGAQGEWHGFGSRGFACVCICTVEVLCDTRVHAGGMMMDYITHRSQKRKKHFECQILLIILLEYPSGKNVCASM